MSAEQEKCVRYIVACINEFALQKKLDRQASFRYLYNNKGIAFLKEHYEIEHTLSMQDTIDDLTHICRRNGGMIQ